MEREEYDHNLLEERRGVIRTSSTGQRRHEKGRGKEEKDGGGKAARKLFPLQDTG